MSDVGQIILQGRAIIDAGGRLYSKGSKGISRRLRVAFLDNIDATIPATLTSLAAKTAPAEQVVIEHLIPMKRIAIEIIDPAGHDPRTGGDAPETIGPPFSEQPHNPQVFPTRILDRFDLSD